MQSSVEKTVNDKINIKLKINPTENLEEQVKELLGKRYFPRFRYQLNFLAKFIKHINGEEQRFHKWVKSV